ncbi:snRNA-activating protein complex subunit 2 [Antennarius striatus]|uniref:snRNA-activating protein complex subunit 2 n=1 Tax=Antennarius striatus TaxID=241820 RepID=UPI0035AF8B04
MKPPPRKRTKRDSNLEPESVPGSVAGEWRRPELVQLLGALKRFSRTVGPTGDLDYPALKRSVPTRSTAEVQALVETLRDKVISRASFELKRRRAKENKVRKPMELWGQMASVVAGTLVEPMSSAFSQMLTVCSIEPRSLKNSDPPQVQTLPADPHRPAGRTITFRPMPRSLAQGEPPENRAVPQGVQTTAASSPEGGHPQVPPPQHQLCVGASASQPSAAPIPQPAATSQMAPPSSSSSSSSSCPATSTPPLSSPPATVQSQFGRTSKYSTKDSPRTLGVKCVVDFEKIYRYLSAIHKQNEECCLTPMESAIVLDLLMSLPEELPLLNCNKLQSHLLKVYQCLSLSANSRVTREMFKDLLDGAQSKPSGSSNTSSQSEASTEPCLPLNPFLIPLKLLVRR